VITSLFFVKLAHGDFKELTSVAPTPDFDESKGYEVGDVLLQHDGSTWVCKDNTVAAAIWALDISKDELIKLTLIYLTGLITKYLDNYFIETRYPKDIFASSNVNFLPDGHLTCDDKDFTFLIGDTLMLVGSRRNDGWYDVIDKPALNELILNPYFPFSGTTDDTIVLRSAVFPPALQMAVGRLGAYDIWSREVGGSDVISESIGSYSYTKDKAGSVQLDYPDDLIKGLSPWKRPRIR
jgi:hypothetical protein